MAGTHTAHRGLTAWLGGHPAREARHHLGRHPFQEALAWHGTSATSGAPGLDEDLLATAAATPDAALARMRSHAEGLTPHEAGARLARQGPNAVDRARPVPGWLRLWRCYGNPFNLLLSTLAALSAWGGDARATLVIGLMVALSTVIRFLQEARAQRATEGLLALVSNTATVLRRGSSAEAGSSHPSSRRLQVPIRKLVRGDVLLLSAGDMVPADCRLLDAQDLFVAQGAMTGESLPVEKVADAAEASPDPLGRSNLVFMGTSVISGSAHALVVATGRHTCFGTLAASVATTEATPTAFQQGVNGVSWLLIRFALTMVPLVFVVNGLGKGDWTQALLFALSVGVGLTPEMLPMIVTSTLAKGAVALSRRKVVVKRLDAIQNLGAMDVLCTDKTGTLTQDRIALARHCTAFGAPSAQVLQDAFLNSYHQTGLKNLLDRAVLQHEDTPEGAALARASRKVDEIPFDFQRRRMSVVLDEPGGRHRLVCKGAVEELIAACTHVAGEAGAAEEPRPWDDALRAQALQTCRQLNEEGLRVVGVATRTLPARTGRYTVADEQGLTLVGFVAFFDPPRDSAGAAIQALTGHGVRVVVLTGDNEAVTRSVCRQVGLPAAEVISGPQVQAMDEASLAAAVDLHQVFVKLAPLDKERIVRALRARGHVVGFLGDGINDAPALHAADVGISVDSAVDIAKEAADVILLEKSLGVLDDGVVEGRTTFCNLLKYIRMTASSNFGNVFSVLVASVFLPFLPMLPLQLLTQNLLYDMAQTGIPFDRVDAELVARPLAWNPGDLARFMFFFGPLSSVFDLATFALMWFVFHADSVARQAQFQSGWFVVGLLTQTLVVHVIRTPRLPFVGSRAGLPLLLSTGAIVCVGMWLPMSPLAPALGLEALPLAYHAWLVLIVFGYCAAATGVKRAYTRRHGWQ